MISTRLPNRLVVFVIIPAFCFSLIIFPPTSYAQNVLNLPQLGSMVSMSPGFNPSIIRGITVHHDNPLRFDFIVDRGDNQLDGEALKEHGLRMVKYFLAALTVPENELWVNLSPYEKNRIIPDTLGRTEMGRDLLAQDYLLKQLTASFMHPEEILGKDFWDRIHKKTRDMFGTTEILINTFNKVWIVPKNAIVYENGPSAFVSNSHLTVMLEQDYLALQKENNVESLNGVVADIMRDVLLPEIEKEVNEGEHFAKLRQVYNSMILAMWYKRNLKKTLLGHVYVDKNKAKGIDTDDKEIKQKIYDQYIEAFKKGVYNFIREDYDTTTHEIIPKKYFSGGMVKPEHMTIEPDYAQLAPDNEVPIINEIGNLAVLTVQGYELGLESNITAAKSNKEFKGSAGNFLKELELNENQNLLNRLLSVEGVAYSEILKFREPDAQRASVALELQILAETVFERYTKNGKSYYRFRTDIRELQISLADTRKLLNAIRSIDFGRNAKIRIGVRGETRPFHRGNPKKDLTVEQLDTLKGRVDVLIFKAKGVQEELLALVDENGRYLRAIPKSQRETNKNPGEFTQGSVIIVTDRQGNILMQERSDYKMQGITNFGPMDWTVGGHRNPGETVEETALREGGEETRGKINFKSEQLFEIDQRAVNPEQDTRWVRRTYVYVATDNERESINQNMAGKNWSTNANAEVKSFAWWYPDKFEGSLDKKSWSTVIDLLRDLPNFNEIIQKTIALSGSENDSAQIAPVLLTLRNTLLRINFDKTDARSHMLDARKIIDDIAVNFDITLDYLEQLRQAKNQKRGGFEERIILDTKDGEDGKATPVRKLVRNKIPQMMVKNGQKFVIHFASMEEYQNELFAKLFEEFMEVQKAASKGNADALSEELADLLEVIAAVENQISFKSLYSPTVVALASLRHYFPEKLNQIEGEETALNWINEWFISENIYSGKNVNVQLPKNTPASIIISLDKNLVDHFDLSFIQDASTLTKSVGGIDLNPVFLDLQFRRNSKGALLPTDQQPIYDVSIEGILPVIINLTPATHLLLEVSQIN